MMRWIILATLALIICPNTSAQIILPDTLDFGDVPLSRPAYTRVTRAIAIINDRSEPLTIHTVLATHPYPVSAQGDFPYTPPEIIIQPKEQRRFGYTAYFSAPGPLEGEITIVLS